MRPRLKPLAAVMLLALQGCSLAPTYNVPAIDLPGPSPQLVLPWFNGAISNIGSNVACLSDPPIVETRP